MFILIKMDLALITYNVWIAIKPNQARGVIVIIVGNEHSDTSSNPGRDWLHIT